MALIERRASNGSTHSLLLFFKWAFLACFCVAEKGGIKYLLSAPLEKKKSSEMEFGN